MLKHTKTVCTHQVRECDYKDLGCTYKVCLHSIYSLMHSYNHNVLIGSYLSAGYHQRPNEACKGVPRISHPTTENGQQRNEAIS